MPGRAWAITRGRAISMPARARWRRAMAGAFPTTRRLCARCRASATTPRRRWRRSPSTAPATPVDGNIERVMARLFAHAEPLPEAKPALRRLAATLTPAARAGDYAQAVMDLGATHVHAEEAQMHPLPLARGLPRPRARHRRDAAGAARQGAEAAAARRRLLGGAGGRRGAAAQAAGEGPARRHDGGALDALARGRVDGGGSGGAAPVAARWRLLPGVVRHTFTHFHLELAVLAGTVRAGFSAGGQWVRLDDLPRPGAADGDEEGGGACEGREAGPLSRLWRERGRQLGNASRQLSRFSAVSFSLPWRLVGCGRVRASYPIPRPGL